MRRFLVIIGAVALLVIAAAGAGVGFLFYQGAGLDAESKAYVDAAIPAIVTDWDRHQLIERAAPELLESVKADQLVSLFDTFSHVGRLVEYQGATGEANIAYFNGVESITASYVAKAKFQNGEASIRIAILKRDGRWMIQSFYVNAGQSDRAPRHA